MLVLLFAVVQPLQLRQLLLPRSVHLPHHHPRPRLQLCPHQLHPDLHSARLVHDMACLLNNVCLPAEGVPVHGSKVLASTPISLSAGPAYGVLLHMISYDMISHQCAFARINQPAGCLYPNKLVCLAQQHAAWRKPPGLTFCHGVLCACSALASRSVTAVARTSRLASSVVAPQALVASRSCACTPSCPPTQRLCRQVRMCCLVLRILYTMYCVSYMRVECSRDKASQSNPACRRCSRA